MSVQVCIVRIAGYGPWTLELGSDREHRLQSLQASLYASLQDAFSSRDALVFQNRSDELFALTNGMSLADHDEVVGAVSAQFADIDLRAATACSPDALEANRLAHKFSLLASQDELVCGATCASSAGGPTILHMDVDGLSSRRRESSPYEITSSIYSLYAEMSKFFMSRGALSFFMGGDNFMVVTGADIEKVRSDAQDFVNVSRSLDLGLNCGIGRGLTARKAASAATRSLDEIRRMRKAGEAESVYEAP